MRYSFLIIISMLIATASFVSGQTTAVPTPIPTPTTGAPENVPAPAIAPNFASRIGELPEVTRVGVDMRNERSLSLMDALDLALSNNKDIEVTRENIKIAQFDLSAARGVYEPRFSGQAYYEKATVPNISFFNPQTTTVTSGNAAGNIGVTGYIPQFGTRLDATFSNQRVTSNNLITIFSPQYNSDLTFTVTQPLLRGRSFDQNRRGIEIAKRNVDLSNTQFRQRSIDTVNAVQRAYWDLTYALRNLQVQRDSARDARAQADHNRRLVEEGQLAPIDVVASETQVANFEQAVYDALNTVNQAENNLKNLISPNRNDAIWSQAITPIDSVELSVPATTLGQAVDAAIQNRPEMEINQTQKDLNAIDQRFYRDQKKPQVDLVASYTAQGVGGTLNPNFVNPLCINSANPAQCMALQQALVNAVGSGPSSLSDVLSNKYPTVRAGVQFNIPLFGDKTNRAEYGRTLVEGERLETQREQLEQNIQVDVRNALQAMRTAEARLHAAAIARDNAEKEYASEQRRLDEGQSDVYRVLDRQTALATAKSNELRARTDLNKAIADMQRATGSSLKENNITPK
jgi:HAE1 family hydrophobic/amphiphilic exporter-1